MKAPDKSSSFKAQDALESLQKPGPRNPVPLPRTNDEGFATVDSVEDEAPGAVRHDPAPPPSSKAPDGRPQKAPDQT